MFLFGLAVLEKGDKQLMNENPYILTYTGRKFYPLTPSVDEVHIEDIAHALSNKCRFTGHTEVFYSVAQHSVIVSSLFNTSPIWGLLHDAAEAYLPDVASPIKQRFPTLCYAEQICFDVIKKRFSLFDLDDKQIKELKIIDRAVVKAEGNVLINTSKGHKLIIDIPDVPELHYQFNGFWNPVEAEKIFLTTYSDLCHDYR